MPAIEAEKGELNSILIQKKTSRVGESALQSHDLGGSPPPRRPLPPCLVGRALPGGAGGWRCPSSGRRAGPETEEDAFSHPESPPRALEPRPLPPPRQVAPLSVPQRGLRHRRPCAEEGAGPGPPRARAACVPDSVPGAHPSAVGQRREAVGPLPSGTGNKEPRLSFSPSRN